MGNCCVGSFGVASFAVVVACFACSVDDYSAYFAYFAYSAVVVVASLNSADSFDVAFDVVVAVHAVVVEGDN